MPAEVVEIAVYHAGERNALPGQPLDQQPGKPDQASATVAFDSVRGWDIHGRYLEDTNPLDSVLFQECLKKGLVLWALNVDVPQAWLELIAGQKFLDSPSFCFAHSVSTPILKPNRDCLVPRDYLQGMCGEKKLDVAALYA